MHLTGQEILVVVEERERRERVARTLTNEGFAVTEAAEGLAALRSIGTQRYALIVAARRLPGSLDGPTMVRQARARQPWLKALFIDGRRDWQDREDPDSDDFLSTPFERHELVGCTFELLHRRGAETADLSRRVRARLRAF